MILIIFTRDAMCMDTAAVLIQFVKYIRARRLYWAEADCIVPTLVSMTLCILRGRYVECEVCTYQPVPASMHTSTMFSTLREAGSSRVYRQSGHKH